MFYFGSACCYSQDISFVSVSLDKMNILYIGVDNPITFHYFSKPDDWKCTVDPDTELTKESQNSATVRIKKEGNHYIKFVSNVDSRFAVYFFRGKKLPVPVPSLLNQKGDSILVTLLKTATHLDLTYVPEIDFYIESKLISFDVLKVSKTGQRISVHNPTEIFSLEVSNLIKSAESGDILVFKNITGTDPTNEIFKTSDLILYIK